MQPTAPVSVEQSSEALRKRLDASFSEVARHSVRVWFNQSRLDQVLSKLFLAFPNCELVYAFNPDGRQVSSNLRSESIDHSAFGQDLSRRPIAVSLSVLNNAEQRGVFLCDAYVSQVTRHPCVTVMYRATSGSALLGFIAADFVPQDLYGNGA